ncbi:L-serine ammonia-lyase, iron-sulfur-dependent, subunit alpha [Clostridium estertheticum]|nr:L-serine ammonia-lyase, iron-sulfur-dependent, subunit alpha [Clostridium estertheticum]MCB2346306.1 L-serine ammonia-lyase, iron-sulfur-dependent, subunit alpha [Clostridium estertheticum]MCB2349502.1 L-serine ammonia-lyase, iron-sulfur-dependent, subunit alpha [Clostridium estertheticum]WAG47891.1 L-serine ammonia-lyase, iron-sulfur-dependent, subunit alpha [Clostridium estertheticum]
MGCTEPISIAYASAKAKEVLGHTPDRTIVEVSGNIIKNVKSVIVPNTGHLKGIAAATAAGIIAGNPEKKLEVISDVSNEDKEKIKEYLSTFPIEVKLIDTPFIFDIQITVFYKESYVKVRIVNYHTNIILIEKNSAILYHKEAISSKEEGLSGKELLSVKDIVDFADSVDIKDIEDVIGRQIEYNSKIAEEGLKNSYGANIGSVLISTYGSDVKVRAKAKAAAGSDARMNGCELPVIIVSGSGNQGMTASLPVIEYGNELKVSKEKLYRALVISNLVTIHQKTGIGRLSAYCGAVCAGAGSGAGITYLYGGGYRDISHTIVNALSIVSGIICDGAKASCAAKIATSVDAGILGYHMFKEGQQFKGGDGIVRKGIEATISNVGKLAKDGMKETDKEIIKIMMED